MVRKFTTALVIIGMGTLLAASLNACGEDEGTPSTDVTTDAAGPDDVPVTPDDGLPSDPGRPDEDVSAPGDDGVLDPGEDSFIDPGMDTLPSDPGGDPATDTNTDEGTGGSIQLSGAVQKGPFVVGSAVQVSLLDASLNPTGQVFNTNTNNDLGEFSIAFDATGPVSLQGSGYYYNEVTGLLSASTLALNAFFVPEGNGQQKAYINMITHLTTNRIKALVAGGKPFADAVAQAESELHAALAITGPGYSPDVSAIGMNVAGGDNDDNAYLLAVSSVLITVAAARQGAVESNIQEVLNRTAIDLAGAAITTAFKQEVTTALLAVDVGAISRRLAARLRATGSDATVPDMNRVLDQDRDGIVNATDNCPLAPNADQFDDDHDDVGNACDTCPATDCPAPNACLPATAGIHEQDVCYPPCITDGESLLCDGGTCVGVPWRDNSGTQGLLFMCTSECDPLADDACGPGLYCGYVGRTTQVGITYSGTPPDRIFACVPIPLEPSTYDFEACFTSFTSPEGLRVCLEGGTCDRNPDGLQLRDGCPESEVCTTVLGPTWGHFCVPTCDPQSAPSDCPGGLPCRPDATPGATWGLCDMLPYGEEGMPCAPGRTCEEGLSCQSWTFQGMPICLIPDTDCCVPVSPAPGLYEACGTGNTCADGLQCSTASGQCPAGFANCCINAALVGTEGHACGVMGTCDQGLTCIGDAACGVLQYCCLDSAGPGGTPCPAPDFACSTGYGCVPNGQSGLVCPNDAPFCCVEGAGDSLGDCIIGAMGMNSCNTAFLLCMSPPDPLRCNNPASMRCCVPK